MNDHALQPLIIIGAPRSGTNLLRDLVCQAPGFGTWPCDEINLMWRHGNARYPDDQLPPELATPAVARYMRRKFSDIAGRTRADFVVEKTCANSLRVAFVDRIVPEARYLFILRDGRDAVASAVDRFRAAIDWKYTLRKLRYAPATDLPAYAIAFARNRASRMLRRDRRLEFWGPRFHGFAHYARSASIAELCARQWRECVDLASRGLAAIEPQRVLTLRYEALVRRPAETLHTLFDFVGAPAAAAGIDVSHVNPDGVGRGPDRLAAEHAAGALELLTPTLARLGYV